MVPFSGVSAASAAPDDQSTKQTTNGVMRILTSGYKTAHAKALREPVKILAPYSRSRAATIMHSAFSPMP